MALIDSLHPSKNVFLPNSEEMVTMVLVPQHQVFTLQKEVQKYIEEHGLAGDIVVVKQLQEAATLIRAIRRHGTVNLPSGERGEQVFHSIESFLQRFTDDQAEWLSTHYALLKQEVLPPVSDLTESVFEKLCRDIDAGKDLSPQLKSFDYATLLTFTLSLVARLHQLREALPTKNSRTSFSVSAKRPSARPTDDASTGDT